MAKKLIYLILSITFAWMQFSCQDEGYLNSPDIELKFTTDTIMFDTVFTNFGSATKKLSIYNPYRESVLISKLKLHGAEFSSFNLNYNGKSKTEYLDIEVPARDSIAVYIVVTIDPTGRNLPLIVQDSVEIAYNGLKKCLKLVAYGQDFVLVKGRNLKNTVWTNEKPYLVYNYAYVDSVAELIIQPGARIFFHKGSGLYVKGKITAKGNLQNPISFSSDKLEPEYKNTPDLWNGIVLYSGSHENVFDYVNIRNANIGIQVGNIEKEGFASVQLSNTRIENMSYAGIFALKSKILAYNTVVANCGLYSVALLAGGKYEFYHSTLSNYRGVATSKMRSSPSLVISNFLPVRQFDGKTTVYSYDLESATFGNSIIYGNSPKEIETGNNGKNKFNYRFDHCLIQMPDTFDISNREIYRNIYKGSRSKPKFIDPVRLNLTLDTLSAAKDAGSSDIAKRFPLDFYRKDRTSDLAPDLGAYERIEKKKSN